MYGSRRLSFHLFIEQIDELIAAKNGLQEELDAVTQKRDEYKVNNITIFLRRNHGRTLKITIRYIFEV